MTTNIAKFTALLETATRAYQIARDTGGDSWFASHTVSQVIALLEGALSADTSDTFNRRANEAIHRARLAIVA